VTATLGAAEILPIRCLFPNSSEVTSTSKKADQPALLYYFYAREYPPLRAAYSRSPLLQTFSSPQSRVLCGCVFLVGFLELAPDAFEPFGPY